MISSSALGFSSIVSLFVQSKQASSERRFDKGLLIIELKERLSVITGVPAGQMLVKLLKDKQHIATLEDDKKLGFYPLEDYMILDVVDLNPTKAHDYSDLSQVQKLEMADEEYDKRTDSVRHFKRIHQMGRFAPKKDEYDFKEEALAIAVGSRCIYNDQDMEKRGEVKFVGETKFKPGYWIGIMLDEPLGKNNGTVQGVQYFECPNKHGVFVRPNVVEIGDFPPEELDDF
ncbi:CAP Gly-rich domain-containing protein [Gorgonomyces haynaldii]|nr:CAP Gly-rich domain-containing protein [Gorgonomyces haynaldii]